MLLPVVCTLAAALVLQSQSMADRLQLGDVLILVMSKDALRATDPAARALVADRGGRKGQTAIAMSGARPTGSPAEGERFEYHLVGPGSAGPLPSVDVLGLHYVKVKPDRTAAFERFVRDQLHPAVAHLRADLRILYYKDVRTPGRYLALFALTRASRDKYWPGGADSDELRAAFAPLKPLAEQLRGFLVEGSYLADAKFAAAIFESREWTDFVLQSPMPR